MPRNGSGTYTLPQSPFVAGTVISSAAVNSDLSDIASALTGSLPRDGQAGMTGQLKLPDGSASVPSISFTNEPATGFARSAAGTIAVDILGIQIASITSGGWQGPVLGATPIGTIIDFAGSTAPATWYLCYGQAVSRTTYAALFAVISTIYGAGDGSTTFNLPDLRGRSIYGQDNMGGTAANRITVAGGNFDGTVLGNTGGGQNETLTLAQLPTGITSANATQSITVNGAAGNQILTLNTAGTSFINLNGGPLGGSNDYLPAASNPNWLLAGSLTSNNSIAVTSNNTSGSSHPLMNPALITNKLIFAGV